MKEIRLENHSISKATYRRKGDGIVILIGGTIKSCKLKPFVGIRYKKIKIILEE